MTAQPKPTTADVLREHRPIAAASGARLEVKCASERIWMTADAHAQHQADMLAAAGLLATAEHDREVAREALREVLELADSLERDPGEVGPLILVAQDIRRAAFPSAH